MKILYSASNRIGAAYQLLGFLQTTRHDVTIAGYPSINRLIRNFKWNLAAVNNTLYDSLTNEVSESDFDLAVIDAEPIVASIAYKLDIPIVYCSSLHMIDGCVWYPKQLLGYTSRLTHYKEELKKLPIGIHLIYSPFSSQDSIEGFDWVAPYGITSDDNTTIEMNKVVVVGADAERIKKISLLGPKQFYYRHIDDDDYHATITSADIIISTGDTQTINDAVVLGKRLCCTPDLNDSETILNAVMTKAYGGLDLGQVELVQKFDWEQILKVNKVSEQARCDRLHHKIDTLWEVL